MTEKHVLKKIADLEGQVRTLRAALAIMGANGMPVRAVLDRAVAMDTARRTWRVAKRARKAPRRAKPTKRDRIVALLAQFSKTKPMSAKGVGQTVGPFVRAGYLKPVGNHEYLRTDKAYVS